MKKVIQPSLIVLLIAALVISGFNTDKQAVSRVGYLSINNLVLQIPEYRLQRGKLDTTIYEFNLALQEKMQEFQLKQQAYVQDSANMIELIKEDKIAELQTLSQSIQAFRQVSEKEVARKDSALVQPILNELQLAIDQVAETHGYTHILNTDVQAVNGPPMMLYANEESDVSEIVLEAFQKAHSLQDGK